MVELRCHKKVQLKKAFDTKPSVIVSENILTVSSITRRSVKASTLWVKMLV